jgi:hypothetical protein
MIVGNLLCRGGEEHTTKWSVKIFTVGKPVVTKDQFLERVVNTASSYHWKIREVCMVLDCKR